MTDPNHAIPPSPRAASAACRLCSDPRGRDLRWPDAAEQIATLAGDLPASLGGLVPARRRCSCRRSDSPHDPVHAKLSIWPWPCSPWASTSSGATPAAQPGPGPVSSASAAYASAIR